MEILILMYVVWLLAGGLIADAMQSEDDRGKSVLDDYEKGGFI